MQYALRKHLYGLGDPTIFKIWRKMQCALREHLYPH